MSIILAHYTGQQEEVRRAIPVRLQAIEDALSSHFKYPNLTAAAREFGKNIAKNQPLATSLAVVRDILLNAVNDLEKLSVWIALRSPPAEEGNNTGVIIQMETRKFITDLRDKIRKDLDALPDYFSARAGAVEKVQPKISTEEKDTSSRSKATGGKDGDEEKTNTSHSEERVTRGGEPLFDQVEHVVAVDVKWYSTLLLALDNVRNSYAMVDDTVTKNWEKLEHPKGRDKGRSSHLMY